MFSFFTPLKKLENLKYLRAIKDTMTNLSNWAKMHLPVKVDKKKVL